MEYRSLGVMESWSLRCGLTEERGMKRKRERESLADGVLIVA